MVEGDHPDRASAKPGADVNAVLEAIRLSAATRSLAQQIAADRTGSLNQRLGAFATILAAIGGTSAFVSLSQSINTLWVGAAAAFSILAAVVSGLQTYFNYGAVSGEHRKWAAQFGELARRVAFAQATPVGGELTQKRFDRFNADLAQFDKDSPSVPDRDYQRAKQQVTKDSYSG
jgi:hypothetical protein